MDIKKQLKDLKSIIKQDEGRADAGDMLTDLKYGTDRRLYEEAKDAFIDVFKELVDVEYGDVLYEPEDIKTMLEAVEMLKDVHHGNIKFKGRGKVLQLLNSFGELR